MASIIAPTTPEAQDSGGRTPPIIIGTTIEVTIPIARLWVAAPSPPRASTPRVSSAAVACRGPGDGPRRRGWGSSWSKGGGIEDDDSCHCRQPLSPLLLLPPSPPPPMPPPPCPHPCLPVTISAASANVTASPTLLSMVGCCAVCCPSPTASFAVQIYQPPPSCDC